MGNDMNSAHCAKANCHKYSAISYPMYIHDIEKALETLGGLHSISHVFSSTTNAAVPLKFRPNDPNCHSLYGERQTGDGLLLHVNRGRHGPEAEVVSRISDICRFLGLADHQYTYATATYEIPPSFAAYCCSSPPPLVVPP